MEKLTIISPTQPVENAKLENVYIKSKMVAVRLNAMEGFELVKNGEEPNGIVTVDIPVPYEERLKSYTAIQRIETEETENVNN